MNRFIPLVACILFVLPLAASAQIYAPVSVSVDPYVGLSGYGYGSGYADYGSYGFGYGVPMYNSYGNYGYPYGYSAPTPPPPPPSYGYNTGYNGYGGYATGYVPAAYNYGTIGYGSYGANYGNYGGYGTSYGNSAYSPYATSYPTGRKDAFGSPLCQWSDYPTASLCTYDPQQWIQDPYTGQWY